MESRQEFNIDPLVEKELGLENLKNITKFSAAIRDEAKKQQREVHLALVGGNVKSEKRGQNHKDIDLVLYSPELATETIPKDETPKFDVFAAFVCNVAENLGWESYIDKPYFHDYEVSGDGKVILTTSNLPIEVLPVREDVILNSFESYQKQIKIPFVVLF